MMLLNEKFNSYLDWDEGIPEKRKKQLVQSFIILTEKFPVSAVCNYFARQLRSNPDAENILITMANKSKSGIIQPLYPANTVELDDEY